MAIELAVVINRQVLPEGCDPERESRVPPPGCAHEIVYLKRFSLGTPYPAVVREVAGLLRQPPLARIDAGVRAPAGVALLGNETPPERRCGWDDEAGGFVRPLGPEPSAPPVPVLLVLDATGVGRPVVDMFREAGLKPVPVTLTAGARAHQTDPGSWSVPKRELVSVMQVLMQGDRLRIRADLPECRTLRRELLSFRVKLSDAGHDTYCAWRERDHDDLVLATALACWAGEHLFTRRLRWWRLDAREFDSSG